MPDYSVGEAAAILSVSADTVRRWVDSGQLPATRTPGGRRRIEASVLASFAQALHGTTEPTIPSQQSTRNHLPGIVTKVVKDKVMAQVEVQAGPFRVVALISREAADELQLSPGALVVTSVKSTNVVVEIPTA